MSRIAVTLLVFTTVVASASAQTTAGFSGGTLSGPSPRPPNIIIFNVDDIGREFYPQLGALWANKASDTVLINGDHDAIHGANFPVAVAEDFPNLNRLLALGVNFEGMWGAGMCTDGRAALRSGHPFGYNPPGLTTQDIVDRSPKRQIQDATGNLYRIYHYGKDMLGSDRDIDNDGVRSYGQFASGHGGPTAHRHLGHESNSPEYWFSSYMHIRGGSSNNGDESYLDAPYAYTPTDDPDLYISNGNPMMNQDEWGVEFMFEYITSLYPGTVLGEPLPQSFWAQQSGQPFFVTLGFHMNHLGTGNHCPLQTDGGRIYPTAGKIAEMGTSTDLGIPTTFQVFSSSDYTPAEVISLNEDFPEFGMAGWDWLATNYSCQKDQLKWIDQQLGKTLDWLGPEGLKNTVVIFMGDNGTHSKYLTEREHLRPPHLSGKGQDLTTSDAVGSFYHDDTSTTYTTCGGPPFGGFGGGSMCGKGSQHETGLNVPFVVGGGPVAQHLRGTSSTARLQFSDVSETLIKLVAPTRVTDLRGRDFRGLFTGEAMDPLDHTITMYFSGQAAVLQPDEQGRIYRLMRNYSPSIDHCDYLQDLTRADYWTDLRDDPASQAAWTELNDFIANYPGIVSENNVSSPADVVEGRGNVTCGP